MWISLSQRKQRMIVTPPVVYEAIKDWAVQDRHWEGRPIVRPFWPGGDYESYDYPDGCVVIDNPPFSCISKIVHWYEDKGIDFFLFAPHLTCLGIRARSTIGINADIIYDNGACVSTSFVCSSGPRLRTAPDLHNIIEAAAKKARKEQKDVKHPPRYKYPPEVITASHLAQLSKLGIDYQEDRVQFVRHLDSQHEKKKAIYGSGYLVPSQPIRQVMELERRRELEQRTEWALSDREQAIVDSLGAEPEDDQENKESL